jgi:hypothetical protein
MVEVSGATAQNPLSNNKRFRPLQTVSLLFTYEVVLRYAEQPSATYQSMLVASAESGAFTATLHAIAELYNATSLTSAKSASIVIG